MPLPREIIRQAFQAQLVADGQAWIEMLEALNKTSHAYDDAQAAKIVQRIKSDFYPALKQVHTDFREKL